jgi:glycosyltransferase involved in cell wall biosynthesis
MLGISVIILTYNSEATLGNTLDSIGRISDDIHVVDSFSNDKTSEIARAHSAHTLQHEFLNYSAQRNWAMDHLPLRYDWQLHLDADERLSDGLVDELLKLEPPDDVNGYHVPRLVYFLRRPIYHGGMFPIWHMRLFRKGMGLCENRHYDQHFLVAGTTRRLHHPIIDDHLMTLSEWTLRHNKWSDAEADEFMQPSKNNVIQGRWLGGPIEKKRALRQRYNQLPLFFRALSLFLYRYILRMGFLDGRQGLVFFVLQTFWFRFLVDAKLFERSISAQEERHT